MRLDVTTTAMARPKLVERTYKSFTSNLRGVDWDKSILWINIDPFPYDTQEEYKEIEKNVEELIEMASNYFGKVEANFPEKPNYTNAYAYVWGNAETDVILNLEDDWSLNRPIHIRKLMQHFENCNTLYEVVFRAYNYFYPCTCTSPGLLHKKYYKAVAKKFDAKRNPETQTHSRDDLGIFIPNKKNCDRNQILDYVRVWPEPYTSGNFYCKKHISVDDIGRRWLDTSPYMRPQMLGKDDPRYLKKDQFTSWIKRLDWNHDDVIKFIKGCQ